MRGFGWRADGGVRLEGEYPGLAAYLIVTAVSHWWRLTAPHVPTQSERTKQNAKTPMLCINAPYA